MSRTAILVLLSSQVGFSANMLCPHESFALDSDAGKIDTEIIGTMTAVHGDLIMTLDDGGELGGRSYLGETCKTVKKYEPSDYLALSLADKVMSWDVDLKGAECGCNVAFYLTPMRWNQEEGSCGDYYCDASAVCGVRCTEIDLMEANMHAFHSTLHNASDNAGVPGGFGGGGVPVPGDQGWNGPRDFDSSVYNPTDSECIDTSKVFRVSASFPLDPATGLFTHMAITLSQATADAPPTTPPCALNFTVGGDLVPAQKREMTRVLTRGVTPIMSYWSGEMAWLDGEGADGLGPCSAAADHISTCTRHTSIANMVVSDLHGDGGGGGGGDGDELGGGADDETSPAADDDGGRGNTGAGAHQPSQGEAPVALIVLIVVGGCAVAGICLYQTWDAPGCINLRDKTRAALGQGNPHTGVDERAQAGGARIRRVGGPGGGGGGGGLDSAASLGSDLSPNRSRRRNHTRDSAGSDVSPSRGRRSRSRSFSRDAGAGHGDVRNSGGGGGGGGDLSPARRRASKSPARRHSKSPQRRGRSPLRGSRSPSKDSAPKDVDLV